MIKCLIFDLDNTLIEWKKEYVSAIPRSLDKLNIKYNKDDINNIDSALVDYENHYDKFYYDELIEFINKKCNLDLPVDFVNTLVLEQGNCFSELSSEFIETIEYLNNKYNLVVISNWFTKTQKLRLENAGILKYFKLVSGGDERVFKPDKKAFDIVLKDYKPSECIMIGDSMKSDIIGALNAEISPILITNEKFNTEKFKTIKNIIELREML